MATRSLNRVLLIGNLTRDPELRYTPQGNAVCTFGLATNRSWTTEDGGRKEEAEFHTIVAWNKLAEICAQYLTKGRQAFVEGRLSTREWEGQDGVKRRTTEVVASEVIFLGGGPASRGEDIELPSELGAEETTSAHKEEAVSQEETAPKKEEKKVKDAKKEDSGEEGEEIPF
ncbi:MAG: single-stranded DNA-binding protein [Candidatus Blackburnbacteria bacterium]|nr:single-stranded DNA-binding protein [Candidatus Blackburnbacteria bacterium]